MDYRERSQKAYTKAHGFVAIRFRRSIRHVKKYLQKRRAEQKKQTPTDRAASSTARATWAIAILTLATIGVGVSQYFVFGRQLSVMQGQLDAMEADQRPWVYVVRPALQEPGIYTVGDFHVFRMTFLYKNVGKTPAKYVYSQAEAQVAGPDEYGNPNWEKCDSRKTMDAAKVRQGVAVFPTQDGGFNNGFAVPHSEFLKLKNEGTGLVVFGCIDYLFTSGATHHQTRFFYEINRTTNKNDFLRIDPDNPPVGTSGLAVATNPTVAGEAD